MRVKRASLVLVALFVAVTTTMTTMVGAVFTKSAGGGGVRYDATFSDASGLVSGVDVRAAGVKVGQVESVELDGTDVRVEFSVDESIPVNTGTEARIRYANLTGDRYLELTTPPTKRDAPRLASGATIPASQTSPALDLDELYAGFDPLMQAIDPEEMNSLAGNILAVTQGEAGSVERMLANVASFTSSLAERDELIGDVITNLDAALTEVSDHRGEFEQLLIGLADLSKGLAADRKAIGRSIESVAIAAERTAGLLDEIRPALKRDVEALGEAGAAIAVTEPELRTLLPLFEPTVRKFGRIGVYGSAFNFFICGVRVRFEAAPGVAAFSPMLVSNQTRCKFRKEGGL